MTTTYIRNFIIRNTPYNFSKSEFLNNSELLQELNKFITSIPILKLVDGEDNIVWTLHKTIYISIVFEEDTIVEMSNYAEILKILNNIGDVEVVDMEDKSNIKFWNKLQKKSTNNNSKKSETALWIIATFISINIILRLIVETIPSMNKVEYTTPKQIQHNIVNDDQDDSDINIINNYGTININR